MMESGSELYEAMKSSMKASPISNSSLRDRRFSRRVIVGWEAKSIPSEADRPAHIFRIPSRHSLSQSSASSKPAIIWYILWRSISVWLCTTMGSRRGSLIQDSMRSMMRLDDFSYCGQGAVRRARRVRVRRNLPSLSCQPRAQVQTVQEKFGNLRNMK